MIQDNDKPVESYWKLISTVFLFSVLIIISYFIYKPLTAFFVILGTGYLSKYLRRKFIYFKFKLSVYIVTTIWSIFFVVIVFYLTEWIETPIVLKYIIYLWGLMGVSYIGFKKADYLFNIFPEINTFYKIALNLSILLYIVGLVLLNIIYI